jgi:hypothetical protein
MFQYLSSPAAKEVLDSVNSMRPCIVMEHPPYSPDMSPCDYELFAKMKELRGTRCNTREGIIGAVGRSLLGINRSGRADGVRRLPQIWVEGCTHGGRLYCRNVCLPDFRSREMLPILSISPLYITAINNARHFNQTNQQTVPRTCT